MEGYLAGNLHEAARREVEAGRWEQAARKLERAVEIDPDFIKAHRVN